MSVELYEQLLKPEGFFENLATLNEEELLAFIRYWHDRGESGEEIKASLIIFLKNKNP